MSPSARNPDSMRSPAVSALGTALISTGESHALFRIPADHPALEGHFPGNPLLPGVVQIALLLLTAERLTARLWRLQEVRRAKFLSPVLPGQIVRVEMKTKLPLSASEPSALPAKPELEPIAVLFDFTVSNERGEPHAQIQLRLAS